MNERRQNARDLACVREACAKARMRAWSLPEGSLERVAACSEVRRLEQVAATKVASMPVEFASCGACGGAGFNFNDNACLLCHGSGQVERLRSAA